jgi:hypothetical protein
MAAGAFVPRVQQSLTNAATNSQWYTGPKVDQAPDLGVPAPPKPSFQPTFGVHAPTPTFSSNDGRGGAPAPAPEPATPAPAATPEPETPAMGGLMSAAGMNPFREISEGYAEMGENPLNTKLGNRLMPESVRILSQMSKVY